MTNYECIKAMSVEEMAGFLGGECCHCAYANDECYRNSDMHCVEGAVIWLNLEAEE